MRCAAQQRHGLAPVDRAFADPEVLVAFAVIVVEMRRANLIFHGLEAGAYTLSKMGVPDVEAKSYVVKMCGVEDLLQAVGFGDLVGNILHQHRNSQWLGEYAQVLESGNRELHLARLPLLFRYTEMLDKEAEGCMFSQLDSSLRFVHSCNPRALIVVDQIHDRSHMASVIGLRVDGRVHRVQHARTLPKPARNLTHSSAIGV